MFRRTGPAEATPRRSCGLAKATPRRSYGLAEATPRRAWRRALLALAIVASAAPLSSAPTLAAPSRAELEAARERLGELEKDFELAVERYDFIRHRLTRLQASIAADEVVVDRLSERMSVNQAAASRVAEELYKGGSTDALEAVLSSESLVDADARLTYLRSSEAAQARVFERLAVDRRLLNERIERLEVQRAQAREAEHRIAQLKSEITAKIADQREEIDRLTTLIERAERRRAARELRAEAAASAASASAPGDAAAPIAAPVGPVPSAGGRAAIAVRAALAQVGKPYQWGAAGPDSFDCSGLTMYAWAQAGVSLPHSSAAQYGATPRVSASDLQPGDLLFHGSPIHHVAMYIGSGQMVEAPYTGASVRVVSSGRSDTVGAGRPGV
jgi:cell wall-associated NlpC family hydrolase